MSSELFASDSGRIPRIDLSLARREERHAISRRTQRDLGLSFVLVLLAGAILAPLTFYVLNLHAQLTRTAHTVQAETHRGEQLPPLSGDIEARLAQWSRFTKSRDQRLAWWSAVQSIVTPIPAEVYVDNIQISGKGDAITLTLNGAGERVQAVRAYAQSLAHVPGLHQAHLTETSADLQFGPEAMKFTLTAQAVVGRAAETH